MTEECVAFIRSAFLDILDEYKTAWFREKLPVYGTPLSLARVRAFHSSERIHGQTGVVLLELGEGGPVASEFRRCPRWIAPWGFSFPSCPKCCTSVFVKVTHENATGMKFRCRCGARSPNIIPTPNITTVPMTILGASHYVFPFPHPLSGMEVLWETPDGGRKTRLWLG